MHNLSTSGDSASQSNNMEEETFTLNYDHRHSKVMLRIPLDLSLLNPEELNLSTPTQVHEISDYCGLLSHMRGSIDEFER